MRGSMLLSRIAGLCLEKKALTPGDNKRKARVRMVEKALLSLSMQQRDSDKRSRIFGQM